ncbi:MAG: hypothetical protein ACYC27_03565 [Armatimonadota bacterium]
MKKIVISILFLVVTALSVSAAEDKSTKISIQFKDADISTVLSQISQKSGIPVMGDTSVKGKVNCKLNNVTIEQVLDTVCQLNKLSWMKVYTTPEANGSFVPSKLFKLYDTLAELGGTSFVCENPKTGTQTAFVNTAKTGTIGSGDLASSLKLKPVYIVRIMPEITVQKAEKAKQQEQAMLEQQKKSSVAYGTPPADPTAAADQVWGYFNQMTDQQRREVMGAIRQKMIDSLSPEQKERIQGMMRDHQENHQD